LHLEYELFVLAAYNLII